MPWRIRLYRLYRQAGALEYWIVTPEDKNIQTYRFYEDHIKLRIYKEQDAACSDLFPGLAIPLAPVFAK